jgi:hypothetical protein
MPLYPVAGANADPERGGATVNCIMHQQFATISRGGRSLLELLRQDGVVEPSEHVAFFGLRAHGAQAAGAEPVHATEQVYVHSKLLLVDGRAALLGSANLNDRSLLGERDSEVNVLVRDADDDGGRDGAGAAAGAAALLGGHGFSATLQAQLLTEHLGLARAEPDEAAAVLADPASARGWAAICAVGQRNARLLHGAFRCVPSDEITSFAQLDAVRQRRAHDAAPPGLPQAASSAAATLSSGASATLESGSKPLSRGVSLGLVSLAAVGTAVVGAASPRREADASQPSDSTGGRGEARATDSHAAARDEQHSLPASRRARRTPEEERNGDGSVDGGRASHDHDDKRAATMHVDVASLGGVQGTLCAMPLHFLERERLQPENPNLVTRELIETLQ